VRTPTACAAASRWVGAFGAQPVGGRRHSLGLSKGRPSAYRRELVDDRLGLGLGNGVGNGLRVERVDHDRLGAERAQRAGLARGAGRADDLVAARHELRNEVATDRAGRAGNKDLHDISVRWVH
jgi:hypothetical protein